jgi:hypothetical protein
VGEVFKGGKLKKKDLLLHVMYSNGNEEYVYHRMIRQCDKVIEYMNNIGNGK